MTVNGLLVKAVRFADEQAMVSSSNTGLQRIIDALNKTSNDYGMKINIEKTKVMRVCKTGGKKMKITINTHRVEQVRQFVDLGSAIIEDCKCHEEVKRRIAIGKEAFSKPRRITARKDEVRVKEKNNKDSDLEYGIVCRRNMDVEESGHSTTGIV